MTSPREADQAKESKSLSVSEVDAGLDGTVAARIKDSDTDTYVWFKLPDGHRPHPDLIASAFAAVFGNFYDEWIYSAPISESAAQRLESATQSRWTVSGRKIEPYAPGRETLLNFSGGFDSLAAAALLKGHSRLVSIDFGARFEREKRFFERFDSAVVATNVRGLEKSWTFMGAPSILLADYFSAGYISFGSILEASPWNFVARRGVRRSHPVFEAIGLIETNPLVGLTEFSSARLALSSQPDLVVDSLVSLADQHTEKYLRKSLLLSAAADKEGIHELPVSYTHLTLPTKA